MYAMKHNMMLNSGARHTHTIDRYSDNCTVATCKREGQVPDEEGCHSWYCVLCKHVEMKLWVFWACPMMSCGILHRFWIFKAEVGLSGSRVIATCG